MTNQKLKLGTVHSLPEDMRQILLAENEAAEAWNGITPIARNEFICWVENAKQTGTRERRIKRTIEELLDGQKRPCCWVGCIHRTDKVPSKWQQDVLIDKKPKSKQK